MNVQFVQLVTNALMTLLIQYNVQMDILVLKVKYIVLVALQDTIVQLDHGNLPYVLKEVLVVLIIVNVRFVHLDTIVLRVK